ncbi:MAG: PKD domain-containing protein [Bacteroidia bacterium]|nr:PKD domain-containing protein [Bacteroidia bacterium]
MSVCGFDDTARITVYNISASNITGVTVTVQLPVGIMYRAGSVQGTGVSESNISNLNKPVFKAPNLFIAQYFSFRIKMGANCDIVPLLSGSYTPLINVRVDYSGNYDAGMSQPFVPSVPSPGFASITNQSFIGNVGDKFVRKITLTNYGKGPLSSLRFMRITGKDLVLKSEKGFNTTTNKDTAWTTFSQAEIGKVGNKDTLLQQNESVVITDTITITGCTYLSTYYELQWGCGGKLCQITKNNALVTIGSSNPNLKVVPTVSLTPCLDGTTAHKMTLMITNIGNLQAKGVFAVVYQAPYSGYTYWPWEYSRIDTGSLQIQKGWKGTKSRGYPDSGVLTNAYAGIGMGTAPMGVFRLRMADMSPKDTWYVTWNVYRYAPQTCNSSFYEGGWAYNVRYLNQCKNLVGTGEQWGGAYSYSGGSVSAWTPTDLVAGETKTFSYTFGGVGNVPMDPVYGRVKIQIKLPQTLTHSLSTSDIFINHANLTSTWYPDSVSQRNDTVTAHFGRAFKFNISQGELLIRLTGTCAKTNKNLILPVSVFLKYNPSIQCTPDLWITPVCNTVNTKVHCSSSCNGGMKFLNFELYRSNFGLPDNNNDGLADGSGTIDKSKIRVERAMVGDTITTIFIGRPRNATGINNWRYGYAESNIIYGNNLTVVDARLEIVKGGKVVTGNCTRVKWKKVTSGANATFTYDYTVDSIWPGGCLSSSYRYGANDSMRLIVRYKVTGNIQTTAQLSFANRYYLSTVANPTASQSYQCDSFSGNMVLYGYYFTNYGPDNITYANCAETWIHQYFYLGIGTCCSNYGGANVFPYEYRNWAKIKALRLYLPAGLKINRSQFAQYRTAGSNTTVAEVKDTIPAKSGSGNPYVFDLSKYYKDSGGKFNPSDDGFHGYFYYSVIPGCNLPANKPLTIDYDYIFERKNALGVGYDTVRSSVIGTSDRFTFQPPNFVVQPAISTVYATKDTVEWEVRYSNPSTTFNAYNIWLSPGKNSNIRVVEVRDAVKDTVIKKMVDIYRAGTVGAGQMRRFKVRAVFSNCTPDSLVMYAGWNCQQYPADFASYSCTPQRTTLFLEPQNTRLQLTLKDSAAVLDLCAGNKMSLLVENIQSVATFNNRIQITLPIGMDIVSGSAGFKYPVSASQTALPNPVLISGTTWEWDLGKYNAAIAKGFIGTIDTSKNKLFLVFRVKTNCDYASGSFISARAVANIRCGDAVPAIPAFSNPLDIKGVTRPYYTLVKAWTDSLLPCQKPSYFRARVVILGPAKTGIKDRVEILVPAGVTYDTSYWNPIRNAPSKDSIEKKNINGATLLSWKIPAGIIPGDSLEFEIRVQSTGSKLTCGPADVLTRAVVVQPVVCISTGIPCDIKVITGSTLNNPIVDKGLLSVLNPGITARLLNKDTEEVVLKYLVKNTGKYMNASSPLVFRYHYDANTNGKWDAGEALLGTDTAYKMLLKDSVLNMQRKIRVKAGQSCAMLVVIDSAACSCKFGQAAFAAPRLALAGRDTAICDGKPLTIGLPAATGFNYRWDPDWLVSSPYTAQSPLKAPNSSGTREDHLMVQTVNRGLCTSKDSVWISVLAKPGLNVIPDSAELCSGAKLNLSAVVTGANGKWKSRWIPGSGLSDSTKATTVAKPLADTKYRLLVTDSMGCSSQDSVTVKVFPYPSAWFTWPVTCQGQTLVATDKSAISRGRIQSLAWKAGSSDSFNVSVYPVPMGANSRLPVRLIAESDKGCIDTVIRMVDVRANPRASFSASYRCFGDSTRFVQNSIIDSGSIQQYNWTLGDGNTSSASAPVYRYSSFGDYTVRLAVKSADGCTDTVTHTARVFPVPAASFAVNPVCKGDSLRFANTTNLFGDTLLSWKWDFAGLGASVAADPVWLPVTAGTHSVRLVAQTLHGCRDTFVAGAVVNALPTAGFTSRNHCLQSLSVFADSTRWNGTTPMIRAWSFGDGGNSGMKDPVYTYTAPGSYTVKLKVTTSAGCTDSISSGLIVHPLAIPSFPGNPHCFRQNFTGTPSVRGGGVVKSWKWHTGNGDSSTQATLNYKWTMPGTYLVKLQVQTDSGCVRDTQANIVVYPLPAVAFTATNPCMDDSLLFTNQSAVSPGSIAAYNWTFGDGSTSAQRNLQRNFGTSGTYSAKLIVTTDKGCMDSSSGSYSVYPAVSPSFAVSPVCEEESSVFTHNSTSTAAITAWSWDMGDGTKKSAENPVHTYKRDNTWSVLLTITTLPGCTYSYRAPAIVNPKPVAFFTTNPSTATILNPNIAFLDSSTGADTIWYRLSTGSNQFQRNFTYGFPDSGSFGIKQYAITRFGCKDSFEKQIVVNFMFTVYVPTAFTPNVDGRNEMFGPVGMGIKWYGMKIWNRWGELMFETTTNQPWDGTYKGKPVPDGAYAVLIEMRDYKGKRHYYRGSLTVMH